MVLKRITDYLLFWTFIHLPNTDAKKVIKAVEGATVHLPCHLPPVESQQVTVEWTINTHSLSLKPLNSTNDSCVHLLCSLDSDLANFTWSRGGQMLPHVSTFNADNSELQLCKPDWSEGDTITCHVNYSGTQTQKSIKFSRSENANRGYQDFPAVFVTLMSIFISFI
uniref:Si:ch211-222e20.4 n=1 Tax=Danio rerio TaxID=7955 RepID=E9QIP9_DANRE